METEPSLMQMDVDQVMRAFRIVVDCIFVVDIFSHSYSHAHTHMHILTRTHAHAHTHSHAHKHTYSHTHMHTSTQEYALLTQRHMQISPH